MRRARAHSGQRAQPRVASMQLSAFEPLVRRTQLGRCLHILDVFAQRAAGFLQQAPPGKNSQVGLCTARCFSTA